MQDINFIVAIITASITAFCYWIVSKTQLKQDRNRILFERKISIYYELINAYKETILHHGSEDTKQNFVMIQRQAQLLCSKDIKEETNKFYNPAFQNDHHLIWGNLLDLMKADLKL